MSHSETAETTALDEAPGLIRGHRRSGLSGATVEALKDASKELDRDQIASVRESFRGMFGNATADQALRQIDRRIGGEKGITGEHVQTAAVAAMEMLSPLIRAGKAASDAEARVARAEKGVAKANQDQELAQAEFDRRDRDRTSARESDRYFLDSLNPGVQGPYDEAKAKLEAAKQAAEEARAEKADAAKALEKANRNLDTTRQSLDASFEPGEDQVKLEHRYDDQASLVTRAAERQLKAQEGLKAAQEELDRRSADRDKARERDRYYSDSLNPGIQKPYEDAAKKVEEAKAAVAEADAEVEEALNDLRETGAQLSALKAGPELRRAQLLMDNMGSDPRLQQLMAAEAPSSWTEKGVAWAKSTFAPKELGKTALGVVPLASTVIKYIETVGHEDTERRLSAATERMGKTPMATGVAQVLERDAEISKNKAGIGMAIGFVASGISTSIPMVGGNALGALLSPVTNVISTGVSQGTASALGATASDLLGKGVAWGTTWVGKKIVTTGITKGAEEIAPDQIEADRRKLAEKLSEATDVSVPEGTAMPAIPKPDGSSEAWSLGDPKVVKALLIYLGPGPDQAMLDDPSKRDAEERRLLLREQTFGTPRDVSLTPGQTATELDKTLIERLDKGNKGGGVGGPQVPPLHTMYAALGWLKT